MFISHLSISSCVSFFFFSNLDLFPYLAEGTYPQQWSSPLPPPPARISPTTTPPHSGLLMPAMGHVMPQPGAHILGQPSTRAGPHMVPEQQYLVDSDRMLAHYLQFLEQSKAIPRYPGEPGLQDDCR